MEVDRLLSLEEFDALPDEGSHAELWRGRLVHAPAPDDDWGRILGRLAALIDEERTASGTGCTVRGARFLLSEDPPTVLAPPLAFVTRQHLSPDGDRRRVHGAPDLAVEIVTGAREPADLHDRALDYLEAGARVVWVVDPRERSVAVYHGGERVDVLTDGDLLDAEPLLPGLELEVGRLFAETPPRPTP